MKKQHWLHCAAIAMAFACSEQPGVEIIPEDHSGVDPLIAQLRSYNNFPIDYDDGTSHGKAVLFSDIKQPEIASGTGYSFSYHLFAETTKLWNSNNHLGMIGKISAAYSSNTYFSFQIQKSTESWLIQDPNFAGYLLSPATGVALSSSNAAIADISIGAPMMAQDGTLGTTIWYNTDPATMEMSLQIPDALSPRRVLIGFGATVRSGNVVVMWGYTAPYDPVTKRILVTTVDDVHLLLKAPTKQTSVSGGNQDIEVIYRTFDVFDQVSDFKRAFITGVGARTEGDDIRRVGMKITLLNN